jgi:hypothetical protein
MGCATRGSERASIKEYCVCHIVKFMSQTA